MNIQSPRSGATAAVGLALLVALSMVPTARAQIYGPWSPPDNLNDPQLTDANGNPCIVVALINSPFNDTHPALSKDGLSLYFASNRPGFIGNTINYDLWVSHRASLDDCWQPPVNLGPVVNSSSLDFAPNLSNDGHWLFFHSNRPGGCGGLDDLYASHREKDGDDTGWEPPVNLGCALNTLLDQGAPDFFDDGKGTLFLYIVHNLTPTNPDDADIYVSTCTADIVATGDTTADAADTCNRNPGWSEAHMVPELNSPVRETTTAIRRRDGLEMILTSNRCVCINNPNPIFRNSDASSTDSMGSGDLWVSTRATMQDKWSTPVNLDFDPIKGVLVPNVNSPAFDGAPALSWDGTELYFYSERAGVPGFAGGRDLYRSTRKFNTSTALSSSANPSVFGQSVTFTATVSSANDSAPTGTVKFSDGSNDLDTGALVSGQASFTTSSLSIGSHSNTGLYGGDRISSGSSDSLTQNVEYGVCPLYDQTRSVNSGATFPIRLQLCDVNGNDLSSSAIVVHATSITAISGFSGTSVAPGNANPDNDFRFDPTLGPPGGYIFNLSTAGLASGTYSLQFIAGSDLVTHSVNFGVK